MRTPDNPIPAQLKVVAWPDPVIDALGFLPHDPYSELVATPTLSPRRSWPGGGWPAP